MPYFCKVLVQVSKQEQGEPTSSNETAEFVSRSRDKKEALEQAFAKAMEWAERNCQPIDLSGDGAPTKIVVPS